MSTPSGPQMTEPILYGEEQNNAEQDPISWQSHRR